jgi:hypothetical protein
VQLQGQLERLQRQWQQDRMEAEQMIRQLIEQLTDREIQRGEAGSTGPAQAA